MFTVCSRMNSILTYDYYDACSTKPTVLDSTYSVLSLSRIKKRGKQNKSQKPNQKETFVRNILACFSKHIKTGFHKSQGTEIRRTDW